MDLDGPWQPVRSGLDWSRAATCRRGPSRRIVCWARDDAPLITGEDRLSSEAAELLTALVEEARRRCASQRRPCRSPRGLNCRSSWSASSRRHVRNLVGDPSCARRLPGYHTEVDPEGQGQILRGFLGGRPLPQISPGIVPRIAQYPWAQVVFRRWKRIGRDRRARESERLSKGRNMGTSKSSTGPGAGVSLVPPWADPPPGDAPPVAGDSAADGASRHPSHWQATQRLRRRALVQLEATRHASRVQGTQTRFAAHSLAT